MIFKVVQTLIIYVLMYVLAFDDIFVDSHEMIEHGRTQYQILREKSNLPRYGTCWKGALDHVEDGCRNLSEDTQSDMALHLTNCFLEMSGHQTYNCELDKKPNLRSICINGMSDRAFNVYTEFYTHVQNICWFLRGQVWHETISENSFKVGKQLEMSAVSQAELLEAQRESVRVQNAILERERVLENVLGDLYVSARAHQDILRVLTKSVAAFQAWVVGEVSWVDSIVFYFLSILLVFILTATKRTVNARLPLLLLLCGNFFIERFICFVLVRDDALFDTHELYQIVYKYVWYSRDFFIILVVFYFIYHAYSYKDVVRDNNRILRVLVEQNGQILDFLRTDVRNNNSKTLRSDRFDFINESFGSNGFVKPVLDDSSVSTIADCVHGRRSYRTHSLLSETSRYNLRSSKQSTPEVRS